MKGMQKKCEKLEKNKKKLEQKVQAASQENLEQLRENNNASIKSQMELSIEELESELSKKKTSQAELEKYKKLYLEQLKVRKSLENKLDETNERLLEMSTKVEVEKEQNRSLLNTHHEASPGAPLRWEFQ